jgi:hypothetical protein
VETLAAHNGVVTFVGLGVVEVVRELPDREKTIGRSQFHGEKRTKLHLRRHEESWQHAETEYLLWINGRFDDCPFRVGKPKKVPAIP